MRNFRTHSLFSLALLPLALSCVGLFVSGCSMFSSEPEEAEAPVAEEATTQSQKAEAPAKAAEEATPAEKIAAPPAQAAEETEEVSSVEILWQVPGEAVEKYYLRYGTEESALDTSVTIPVRELDKIDHPDHGPLFRYLIPSIPAEKAVYFTIQAENQYGLSPESPVQKVEPK